MRSMLLALALPLVAVAVPGTARGDEHASEADVATPSNPEDVAARDANTPLPRRSVLKVEPDYTFHDGGGYTVETKVQPTLRYDGFFLPGLVVPGFVSFFRAQIYLRSIDDPRGDVHESGLTDLLVVNGIAHTFSRRFAAAIGYSTTLPMATSSGLDHQQWQLGPALFVTSEPLDWLSMAVLVESFWTIAKQPGTSNYGYMTVQPFVTWHLPAGWYVGMDPTWTFDFTGNGRTDIPLNLGFGKAFGPSFVAGVQGWYTVAGANQGNSAVHLKLTFTL
jgi:hypothetical protein